MDSSSSDNSDMTGEDSELLTELGGEDLHETLPLSKSFFAQSVQITKKTLARTPSISTPAKALIINNQSIT